jgi:hypothetical protein
VVIGEARCLRGIFRDEDFQVGICIRHIGLDSKRRGVLANWSLLIVLPSNSSWRPENGVWVVKEISTGLGNEGISHGCFLR